MNSRGHNSHRSAGIRRSRGRAARHRGIASLEFVMILPVLLVLLFGVMEMGWMLVKQGQLVNAAREGARAGARAGVDQATVDSIISARMTQAGMGGSGYSANYTPGVDPGDTVTVEISVAYDGNIDLTGFPLVPRPETLSAQVSMSKEGP